MTANPVLWDLDARGVATVTLNRPEVNNAYDAGLINGVLAAMDELGKKPHLRVVVLKGNGKHFQAGADLKWINGVRPKSAEENEAVSRATFEAVQRLNTLPIPTVALVQGGCFGGGTGVISACDVVIAADNALFSITEVRWGLTAAIIIPQLCDAIGVRQVRRYALTGERFGAEEARRIGLVHEVVPLAELESCGREGGGAIAGQRPAGDGRNQGARDGKLVRRHGRRRRGLCAAGADAFGRGGRPRRRRRGWRRLRRSGRRTGGWHKCLPNASPSPDWERSARPWRASWRRGCRGLLSRRSRQGIRQKRKPGSIAKASPVRWSRSMNCPLTPTSLSNAHRQRSSIRSAGRC